MFKYDFNKSKVIVLAVGSRNFWSCCPICSDV